MAPDPHQLFHDLGGDAASIRQIETLSPQHGHAIWRIVTPPRSFILKWLPEGSAGVEIASYALLRRLGVVTLSLYGSTAQALLLEDLTDSPVWRLAAPADVARPEVGQAVARWYRGFHAAGARLLGQGERPDFLIGEVEELTAAGLRAAGHKLGLAGYPVWERACSQIELLKQAAARLGFTLNYNDFHWTNLALSRQQTPPEAIVFDYHLLGVGMRFSDCRNVAGSLAGPAVHAFWQDYGPIDAREEVLDRPLAALYALLAASRLHLFPAWAASSREQVHTGALERDLAAAVALASALVLPADR